MYKGDYIRGSTSLHLDPEPPKYILQSMAEGFGGG